MSVLRRIRAPVPGKWRYRIAGRGERGELLHLSHPSISRVTGLRFRTKGSSTGRPGRPGRRAVRRIARRLLSAPCRVAASRAWRGTSVTASRSSPPPFTPRRLLLRHRHAVDERVHQHHAVAKRGAPRKCEEGDLNPHGFYPTSPSN